MKLSIRGKACAFICGIATIKYATIQGLALSGYLEVSYDLVFLGFLSTLIFIPCSLFLGWEIWYFHMKDKKSFQDKYRSINLSNLVVVFDRTGRILEVNPNFCVFMGYKENELLGREHRDLISDKVFGNTEYSDFWNRLREGSYIVDDFERVSKSGATVWIHATYTPIRSKNNKVHQVIKVATDITVQKNLEKDLLKKNKYLEHAAKILRHDMHSGINIYMPRGIRSLKRRLTPEKIKELNIETPIKLIQEGLAHTQKVYEGVKEFTNLVKDGTKLEKEDYNLSEALEDYLCRTAYTDQVAIDILPEISINRSLFCTAIDNMIRNGLKYNDSEFKMVAITMVDDEHLAIIDNGRGMSQEDFEKLSQPYLRKDGQTEPGTGLGLNIAVAILQEHTFPVFVERREQGTMIKVKIK